MSAAIAFITMSLMALGSFGFFSFGGAASSPRISLSRSAGIGVSYGSTPVNIWYIVTPRE